MPQNPQNIQKLHQVLSKNNFDVGSLEDFTKRLQDPQSRKKLFDVASQNNFDLGDFGSFEGKLGFADGGVEPAGARINQALNAWKQPFQQGYELSKQGNPIAGGLRFAQGALQLPFAPIQAAAEGYRAIPGVGKYLAAPFDLAAAIPGAIGSAVSGGEKLLNNVLGSPEAQNAAISGMLGIRPEAVAQTANALSDVNKTTAAYAFTPSVAKGIANVPGTVGGGFQRLGKKLETKAITPPFSAKKGLETFDRPVETALKGNYGPSRRGLSKLENDLNTLGVESQRISRESADKGTTIDIVTVNQSLTDVLNKADRSSAFYKETVEAVKDVRERLGRVAAKYPEGKVPIDVANELKSSFQNLAHGKYDQALPPSQVHIDLYKKTANALLRKIVQEEPSLRRIGLKQRDLIELKPVLERKLVGGEKSQYVNYRNLHELAAAGAIGAATGQPILGAAAFGAEQALTNPRSLHGLAVAADRLGTAINPGQSFKSLYDMPNPTPDSFIPPFFKQKIINDMGGPKFATRLGRLKDLTDRELIELAKERGLYSNAPLSEAPVSRGGSMNVRGPANSEQIRRTKK